MSDVVFRLLETHRCRDLLPYNCHMTFRTVISLTLQWTRRPSQKFIRVSLHTTVVSQQSGQI